MHKNRIARLVLGSCFALAALLVVKTSSAKETAVAARDAKKSASEKTKFIRVARDGKDSPVALETALTRYVAPKGHKYEGAMVDLIGAVHVGDKIYYDRLNRQFAKYQSLLYELVLAENGGVPDGTQRGGAGGSAVGSMQVGMKNMLDLEFQLDHIDYTKANFVHADMTHKEFGESMEKRDESFFKMMMRMIGQGMAKQARDPSRSSDTQMFMALFAKDRPLRLKRIMAQQFEDMDGQMAVLGGKDGSTIITERNKKALSVLSKELAAGKKSIGIFYGAGHFPDMEERLLKEFGLQKAKQQWLSAWSLTKK